MADESRWPDELRKALLLDLLGRALPPKFAAEKRGFRVLHHEHLESIDAMVGDGAIRESNGRYSPALLSLSELDDPGVDALLADCALVLSALRDRYLQDQANLIAVDDLSQLAEMPRERFMRALVFLQESSSVLSGSQGVGDEPLAKVIPDEKVLRLKSMDNVLGELRNFRKLGPGWTLPPRLDVESETTPSAIDQVREPWLKHLPQDLQTLLAETYGARRAGFLTLATTGARAAVDMVCSQLVGDGPDGFFGKLNRLKTAGHISESQRETLHAVVDLGHAAAHRGHLPLTEDVDAVLDILERALKAQYVDPHTTKRLKQVTPPRQ